MIANRLFLFSIKVSVEVPAKIFRRIVESKLFVECIDLLDLPSIEFEITFEVSLYSGRCL